MASNQKQIDRTTANEYKGHAGIRIKIFSFIIVWCTTLKEQNETNHVWNVWISEPEKNSRRRKKQIRWKLNQIESNGMSNAECLCDCWGSGSGWHLISRYGRTQFMQCLYGRFFLLEQQRAARPTQVDYICIYNAARRNDCHRSI